jgi:hypothetical protein
LGILELPDKEFMTAYLNVIGVRFPTEAERRRYENVKRHYPRISKQEALTMQARIDAYDKRVRIKKKKNQRLGHEDDHIDWSDIVEKVFEKKREFTVPLLVNGEETKWSVTAFNMKEARSLAVKAAQETGAQFVSLIY